MLFGLSELILEREIHKKKGLSFERYRLPKYSLIKVNQSKQGKKRKINLSQGLNTLGTQSEKQIKILFLYFKSIHEFFKTFLKKL